jgi:hypothetical protein
MLGNDSSRLQTESLNAHHEPQGWESANIASIARGASNQGNTGYIFGVGGGQDGMPSQFHNHTLIAGQNASFGQGDLRFDVTLENSKGKRVGMDVIMVSGNQLCGFVVERVMEGGRVDMWNKQNQPPYTVQTGDYIVQVNGVGNWQSLSQMAEEFVKEGRQVSFTVQRSPQLNQHWDHKLFSPRTLHIRNEAKSLDARGQPIKAEASDDREAPASGSLAKALSGSAPPPNEVSSTVVEEAGAEESSKEAPSHMPWTNPPTFVAEGYPEPPSEPPPGLPMPQDDERGGANNIPPPPPPPFPATVSDKDSAPPGPPPPPSRRVGGQESSAEAAGEAGKGAAEDSQEAVLSPADLATAVRESVSAAVITVISGRGPGQAPAGLALLEEALALEREKEDEARNSAENPTTLLAYSLNLQNEDLVALLKTLLLRKPHLRVTVSKALIPDESAESGRAGHTPQAPAETEAPAS